MGCWEAGPLAAVRIGTRDQFCVSPSVKKKMRSSPPQIQLDVRYVHKLSDAILDQGDSQGQQCSLCLKSAMFGFPFVSAW